ncbi:MAG: hypothetical protein L0206_21055, partial [Actinobacteria bacterium]|nr:hypothetical protein [Actinomycetota bacterium]
ISGAGPLPASLVRIDLEVRVAGKRTRQSFAPAPSQSHTFTWDEVDAYGRTLQGRQRVTTKLTYVYAPVDLLDMQGNPVPAAYTGRGTQGRSTVWRGFIGRWDAFAASGLGGWSLSAHHAYDPYSQVLYRGDGGQTRAEDVPTVIRTVAGGGSSGGCGNGVPATTRNLRRPMSVAAGPDGSFYVGQLMDGGFGPSRVCRVDPEGLSDLFAGTGGLDDTGDGGLATSAQIRSPSGLAVGPDGSVYISTQHRVRRVDPDGIITTFAGTGTSGFSGDGGPATSAQLSFTGGGTAGLAIGPGAALYIADRNNGRVRRVGPDGIITTVAGGAGGGFPTGDGGPGTLANLGAVDGLAFDGDGRLYIGSQNQDLIWRLDTDGLIHIVAGKKTAPGCGVSCGDGGPALAAGIDSPRGIAMGPDGSLYVSEQLGVQRIRRIDPDGIISTVAGASGVAFAGDNGPAVAAIFEEPIGVAVLPDGALLVADLNSWRVRAVAPPLPGFSVGDILVPSEDGSEIYEFDATGQHLRTLDGVTEATLLTFGYDPASGLLETMTDADGNVTTILRDGSGDPTAIDPPVAAPTQLGLDANGYLDAITNPAGDSYTMVNTPEGLLDALTTPAGHLFDFSYEPDGRLLVDADPEGGSQTLARSEAAVSVPPIGGG